ncbi:hypothetical protein K493DRAFT_313789 [Basidiobolus meristosporus CBS 931.73]|uniref:Uncharacterized protein n=1 Tax=Basidiobolus meristosporus CBS 931.73 TaxID=1314790 RepID=A0A1Y1YJS0_9FUNG|nr:hypothetical protein K493DRAFT_313789 [Basidiobolus meristosporus CBS 931.73]|eukprot:ORX98093.1 hypothetical protein K493DRAFT_313789 [Basidiobolus meristosporus CBS 931.73]
MPCLQTSGPVGASPDRYAALDMIEEVLRPGLRTLVHTPFFSHYKVLTLLHALLPLWILALRWL